MKKLKTLKDILTNKKYEIDDGTIFKVKKDLKAEAIKWVKELQRSIDDNMVYDSYLKYKVIEREDVESVDKMAQIKWIKYFFDIEEKEIK